MSWIKRLTLTVLLSLSFSASAIDPARSWLSLETDNFVIHFNKENQLTAKRAAAYAEKAHKNLAGVFNWQPEEKTHLVISDETDFSNGYATTYTFNRSVIFISQPDYPNSLEDYDSWLELLIVHEYVHVLHLDKTNGIVSGFRNIFGRHLLLFPNFFQPPWLIEGIATHHETVNDSLEHEGTGRGQSSYFEMMMRMEVAAGVKPVSQVNIPFLSWPGRTSAYLYGVYFYQFLQDVYGEQAIRGLIEAYSNHLVPFMINSNARQVLDRDITELWSEYTDWLENKFNPQLKKINSNVLQQGKQQTDYGYFTDQVKALETGDLFYIRHDPYQHAMLMQQTAEGELNEITEVYFNSRIDAHETQGVLLAQPEYCDNYNLNYDLYRVELESGKKKRITQCGRYRSATWLEDGQQIVAVHINGGRNEMHRLDASGKLLEVLWKNKTGIVIGQPDAADNGHFIVAAVFRPGAGWNIEQFDLNTKQWTQLTADKAIDVYPSYVDKGESVVFSSERNGSYNIYKLNIRNGNLQQLTNVTGGAFKSAMTGNDLYYVGYAENGNDIYRIKNSKAISTEKIKLKPAKNKKDHIDISAIDGAISDYSALSSMKPRWWEPVIFIEEEKSELGLATSVHDALALHNIFFSLAYDSKNEIFTGSANYSYSDRFVIGAVRESSILSNVGGNYAATILKDDYFLYWLNPIRKFESSWNFIMGVQLGINKEHSREPWVLPISDFEDKQAGLAIIYGNTKNYIRSISEADGRHLRLVYENSDVWDSDYTGNVYTLDWREFIQLHQQHVLAVRLVKGWGTDAPESFRLGGEDNDYKILDFLGLQTEELFGKREYTLRGYPEGLPQLQGRRMQLASVEYRFPLGLVERGLMTPPVGLMQWAGSVFMEAAGVWNLGSSADTYYSSAGIELHADVNLFYRINTRMRLGYASGLDEQLGEDRLYFSLGASF